MARVIYSEEAIEDLERIVEFLLSAAPQYAFAAAGQIRTAIDILEAHPNIGRRARNDVRELVISHGASGYLALYRLDAAADMVQVLRIRHQREAGYAG